MQWMRITVLACVVAWSFAMAEGLDGAGWLHRHADGPSAGIASLIDPSLVTSASRTSYGVPYELAFPVCEVNHESRYWDENFGIPPLGTWLLVRSAESGLSTLCTVVGTFGFAADEARLVNISPRVADALGVDPDDGLFGILVEEYLWNVGSLADTRSMFLEQPQAYFSRMEPYLSLPNLESLGPAVGGSAVWGAIPDQARDRHVPPPSVPTSVPDTPVAPDPPSRPPPDGFPHFPWPVPPPSVRPVEFPREFFPEAHTLGRIDAMLHEGLRSVGYFDQSYYYVPSGFAVVTRLEQINRDATPKPEPERWPPALRITHRWSLSTYLRLLFTDEVPVGYGRVLVFVVTDDDCVVVSDVCGGERTEVDQETVNVWLEGGIGRLPMSMADIELGDSHAVWGIVYEFEKPPAGEPYQTFNREHQGQNHFIQAGIWGYFEAR